MPQNALNAPDCISAHIHLKKFPAPPKKLVAFGHSGLLPQTINPRLNPDPDIFEIAYFFTRISLPSTRNQWIPTPRTYFFETALHAERFKTPSTRSRIKNKRVQLMFGYVRTRPKRKEVSSSLFMINEQGRRLNTSLSVELLNWQWYPYSS